MKHLQSFNEKKFFTVKYSDHELSIDDLQNGEWSITDYLNPKIDKIINILTDVKSRVNNKGSKIYSDEVDKIDQMYHILNYSDDTKSDPIEVMNSRDIDMGIHYDEKLNQKLYKR